MSTSIRANALLNGLRTVSTMLFPLLTFPYISRVLGPEGTGKVSFAWTFAGYFVLVAAIGIPYYGIREVAKVRDDAGALRDLAQELTLMHLISSLLASLAFLGAVALTGKLALDPWLYAVTGTSILLSAVGMEWLYEGREEYAYITARSVLFSFLSTGALFLFVHGKDDHVTYAAIGVSATLGSCVLNFWNARGILAGRRVGPWRFGRHLSAIGTIYVMGLISSLYLEIDVLFLGLLRTDHEVGIYAAATKLNKLVALLIASLGAVLMPRLSYYAQKGMEDEYRNMIGKSVGVTLLLSLPCVAGLALLAPEIVRVLAGSQYVESIHCLRITSPVLLFSSLAGILAWQVLYPKGGEKKILTAQVAGAVTACGINFLLVSRWGYSGAATALILSELAVFGLLLWAAWGAVREADLLSRVWRPVVATAGMSAGVALTFLLPGGDLARLLAGVGTGIVLYATALLLLKEPFARQLAGVLRQRVSGGAA